MLYAMRSVFRRARACSASSASNRPDTSRATARQINLAKLTESIPAFTEISLVDHRKENFVRFEANLRNVEELMECHLVSGGYDYLLRFVSFNYYQERMEKSARTRHWDQKYFSYTVLKSPIVKNVLPLKTLLDPQQ
jgi:DNA-binding Lrp family transcriptional regulator